MSFTTVLLHVFGVSPSAPGDVGRPRQPVGRQDILSLTVEVVLFVLSVVHPVHQIRGRPRVLVVGVSAAFSYYSGLLIFAFLKLQA